jgi:aminoglycoside phosphotransferase (APT) family kinase protein
MKRFTVLTALFSISALAIWAFVQAAPEPKTSAPIAVYDATGAMLEAIHAGDAAALPVTGAEARIAPVYDATGAMLEAINPNEKVITVPAYDATAAMLEAINPQRAEVKIVPVYDATGAMLDAINP